MSVWESNMLEAIDCITPGREMNLVITHEIFGFKWRRGKNGRYTDNSRGYWSCLRDYSGGHKNEYGDIVIKVCSISKIFSIEEKDNELMVSFSDPPTDCAVFGNNLRDLICKAGLLYIRSLQQLKKERMIRVIGDL